MTLSGFNIKLSGLLQILLTLEIYNLKGATTHVQAQILLWEFSEVGEEGQTEAQSVVLKI